MDETKGVGDKVSQEEIGKALAGVSTSAKQKADDAAEKMKEKSNGGSPAPAKPLKYPMHDNDRYPCEVKFRILKRAPVTITGGGSVIEDLKAGLDAYLAAKIDNNPLKDEEGNSLSATESAAQAFTESQENSPEVSVVAGSNVDIFKNISLYLPAAYAVSDALKYSDFELGASGATALNVLNSGGSVLDAIGSMISSGVGSVSDAITGSAPEYSRLGIVRVVGAAKKVSPELSAATGLSMGVTVNPNTRAMFKGVGLRSFQFQFKFIPVSEKEAKEVEDIIQRFREHAYPESIASGGVSIGFVYPHMFRIELSAYNRPVGTKIKDCILESVSTSYNPSTMTYHKGSGRSYPSEYTMTLSFREDMTLNAQDIRDGF